jgi:hypothetical protein
MYNYKFCLKLFSNKINCNNIYILNHFNATIKNPIIFIILLYWITKFIFIILFLFSYFNFYVDCIHSGIMVVYKLIFQCFRLVLCNNDSE